MSIVIYRKSDLKCVGTVASNMTHEQELELNVIPNFGGKVDDYHFIETDEKGFYLEKVGEVINVIKPEPEVIIPIPSIEDRLTALESRIAKVELDVGIPIKGGEV